MARRHALGRLLVPLAVLLSLPLAAPPAHAGPGSGPTAIVSLGDSYISGEAGRWAGNSNDFTGDRDGTDRAAVWAGWYWSYDAHRVYGSSFDNGCDRSDVAEVRSASIAVDYRINLACSGAQTVNVLPASAGGVSFKGEAPQADQLATIARDYNVKMIVLSIGGNDLGFADIITDCITDYETSSSSDPYYCYPDEQPLVDSRMPTAMANVGRVIDQIRAVMDNAGYSRSSYRFVLQSYPSPVPRASENRYPESGWSRTSTGGCPFWNADLNWARDSLVPQIANNLKQVAQSRGVDFLDLRDALQSREVCSTAARLVDDSNPPSETTSEWARFLTTGATQGYAQESFHPNYYAQKALGRCLTLLYAQAPGAYRCRNTPGAGTSSMFLTAG